MLIPVYNPETVDYEKSFLANPISAGVTSIEVKQNERFAVDNRIMLGKMGAEKTEIVTVSAVNSNGTTLTVGTTVFSHSADDPVIVMQFDQVKVYRSTAGSGGTYSLLDTVAMDVDNATLQTVYNDSNGLATYYYKVSFRHSISGTESAQSDPIPGGGYARDKTGYIIDEVLQEVSDLAEQHITRNELLGYFNEVNDDLLASTSKPFDFLRTRTTLTRTANTAHVDFPTNSDGNQTMWKFDRMDYNFTDTSTDPDTDITYTLRVIPTEEFRNTYQDNTISSTTVDDKITVLSLDTALNRFRFNPPAKTTAGSVFYLYYWKFFTRIDSEGDTIETPTPRIYKLYFKGMYYRKRGVTENSYNATADRYLADYQIEKARYQQIDRVDKGTPRSFRPVNSIITEYRR